MNLGFYIVLGCAMCMCWICIWLIENWFLVTRDRVSSSVALIGVRDENGNIGVGDVDARIVERLLPL